MLRTGRRLAILATLTGALAAASCTESRSAEPDTSADATTAGPGATGAVGSAPPDGGVSTPTTTPAPTTEPAPTTTARPEITPAMWEAFGDQLAVRLMGSGDYTASYAVAVDGVVVYTGAVGPRVPVPASPDLATDPAATTTSSTASTSTTTSTTTTTTSTSTTTSTTPRPTTTARATTTSTGSTSSTRSTSGTTGRATSTTIASTTIAGTTMPRATVATTTAAAPRSTATTSTTAAPRQVEEAEPTDRFRIASISKVITATVVLQLVEDGLVELDEPVLQPLIDELGVTIVDPAMREVTLRQLLSHTSGFQAHQSTFFGGGTASCRAAAARGLISYLEAPPGTSYRYSNMNFCLLGLLVEHLTGDTYEDVATERLLEPLGIEGMRLAGTFDARPDEVQHPSVPTRNYMEALGAAGAWVASAEDVVRIVDALDPAKPGWHPLPDDVLRYMRLASAGVTYNDIADRWYGLGLIVWADGSWGHTGTVENTHAMVLNRPDGITWSILVNGEYPSESERLRRIFDDAAEAAGLPIAPAGD